MMAKHATRTLLAGLLSQVDFFVFLAVIIVHAVTNFIVLNVAGRLTPGPAQSFYIGGSCIVASFYKLSRHYR